MLTNVNFWLTQVAWVEVINRCPFQIMPHEKSSFDREAFNRITFLDVALQKEIVDLFVEQLPEYRAEADRILACDEPVELVQNLTVSYAHKMKGLAASVCLLEAEHLA